MRESRTPLLKVKNLSKSYTNSHRAIVRAVTDLTFSIHEGEVLGVVGESGCGKSTLARTLLRLTKASAGTIEYKDRNILDMNRQELKKLKRDFQIIFQDPFGSLNPRHRVGTILAEPLKVHQVGNAASRDARVAELLELVGLPTDAVNRYPHEFSGGQRQRIAIARALALEPRLLIADEAVSALDVSIQSQIINLLISLQKQLSLAMLFISHDLSVIRHVSDRIAVMYLGRIVEVGDTEEILDAPQHPYTQALVSAIPHPAQINQHRIILSGEPPDPGNPPTGCAFSSRCQSMRDSIRHRCTNEVPLLMERDLDSHSYSLRKSACHLYSAL